MANYFFLRGDLINYFCLLLSMQSDCFSFAHRELLPDRLSLLKQYHKVSLLPPMSFHAIPFTFACRGFMQGAALLCRLHDFILPWEEG